MNAVALACGVGAILLWSTNAFVGKYALSELSVAQVQTFQFAGAATTFLALRVATGGGVWTSVKADALVIGLIGLVGTMVFQYLAFSVGPIAVVNLLAYAWPLLMAFAVIAMGSSNSPLTLHLVSMSGFVGVALLIGDTGSTESVPASAFGYVFASLSAACMATYSIGVARLKSSPADVLLPASLIGLFLTAGWWSFTESNALSPPTVLAALYLGIGPMGFGYILWSYAMRAGSVGPLSTLGYATPVLSTIFLIASGERLTLLAMFGGAMIVAACALSGKLAATEPGDAYSK